ncbi:MAG: transcription antitermination factor NusB [Isosphaeraceae bacterium]
MAVVHRSEDGSDVAIEARQRDRSIRYALTLEGRRFITDVLRLNDGDDLGADDLDFLIDRGWAGEVEPPAAPVPAPTPPPAKAPTPARPPSPTPAQPTAQARPSAPPANDPRQAGRRTDLGRTLIARRGRAREVALQVLYQQEQNPGLPDAEMVRFIRRRLADEGLRDYATALVAGVREQKERIDELISKVAENWRIDRMAAIDRNTLRLGAYEILHVDDVPTKVAINEAIELAKRYSTAQSSRFVNGILDKLLAAAAEPPPPPEVPTESPESPTEPDAETDAPTLPGPPA